MYYYTIVIIARLKHEYFIYIAESLDKCYMHKSRDWREC